MQLILHQVEQCAVHTCTMAPKLSKSAIESALNLVKASSDAGTTVLHDPKTGQPVEPAPAKVLPKKKAKASESETTDPNPVVPAPKKKPRANEAQSSKPPAEEKPAPKAALPKNKAVAQKPAEEPKKTLPKKKNQKTVPEKTPQPEEAEEPIEIKGWQDFDALKKAFDLTPDEARKVMTDICGPEPVSEEPPAEPAPKAAPPSKRVRGKSAEVHVYKNVCNCLREVLMFKDI